MYRLSGLLLALAAVCLGTDWGVQRTDKVRMPALLHSIRSLT